MADKLLTLYDITKRNGTDLAVGLVEEVTTWAPEINSVLGRPIPGTTYKTRVRSVLPAGPAFRAANEGSYVVASTYDQKIAQCFFLDAQMKLDEAVADAPEEGGRALVMADEAEGVLRQKMIALGDQFYRGTTADAKGFAGLLASYDATNMQYKAGGTSSSVQTSVWIMWNALQGVHFIFGGNQGLNMKEWRLQQVVDANGLSYMAWVNNLSGWIGLSVNHTKSILRICNCEDATNKNVSDATIASGLALFPIGIRNSGQLKIFMNRKAALMLQKSRSVTIFTSSGGGKPDGSFQTITPSPTEALGIPIVITDSITSVEAVV